MYPVDSESKNKEYVIKSAPEEEVEKRKPSYTAGRNVNLCIHYGKQYGVP